MFAQVCEAFDVLYHAETRAIFDAYGEYGLKEGIIKPDGTRIGGGYFLKTNPDNYFEEMFEATDLIGEIRESNGSDVQQSIFADSRGGLTEALPDKPCDVEVSIDVTLGELYNGAMKTFSFEVD